MAQTDAQTKEINDHTYTVMMLDPFVANDVLIELGHVIGPSIGGIVGAHSGGGLENVLDAEPDAAMIQAAIGGLFLRIDKANMRWLLDTLMAVSEVDGKPLKKQAPLHFRGKIGEMYQWLWFALTVQYADFTEWLAPVIARAGDFLNPTSSSPDTSPATGSSIE